MAAQRANFLCVYCGASLERKEFLCGIRLLIGQRRVRFVDDKRSERFIIRIATSTACICTKCAPCQGYMSSNEKMTHFVLDKLDDIAMDFHQRLYLSEPRPEIIWKGMLDSFLHDYSKMLRVLGKIDITCPSCQNPDPKLRCSACNYVRYCNTKCSHAHWSVHKKHCKMLRNKEGFFCTSKITEIKE